MLHRTVSATSGVVNSSDFRCQDTETLLQYLERSQWRWFRHLTEIPPVSQLHRELLEIPQEKLEEVVRGGEKKTLSLLCCHHSPDLKYLEN